MSKALNILFIAMIIAMVPFAYFFMRDFVYADDGAEVIGECVPYDLEVSTDRFEATVKWKTEDECIGYIRYDMTPQDEEGATAPSTDGILPVQDHTVIVKDLKPHNTYYMWIYSNETPFGHDNSPIAVTPGS